MRNIAKFIKRCGRPPLTADHISVSELGDEAVFHLSPPLIQKFYYDEEENKSHEYVWVSESTVMGTPETYIFPCNKEGVVTNWGELDGSFKGELNITKALNNAGYEVEGL